MSKKSTKANNLGKTGVSTSDNNVDIGSLNLDVNVDDVIKKENKRKERKPKKPKPRLKKLKAGRIVGAVFVGTVFSGAIGLVCYGGYMNNIRYPRALDVPSKGTGIYCLEGYDDLLKSMESTGEGSYIYQEIKYANGDEDKLNFYQKMLGTIKYKPYPVVDLNVYGNTLVNRDNEVQYRDSTVCEGEPVMMEYVDYSRVEVDRDMVSILMQENKLNSNDIDYSNKLVNVFCKYMSGLGEEALPVKRVKRIPYMTKVDGVYEITDKEDQYIDRLLFSSDELYDLMERFSAVASSVGIKNPEWDKWNESEDKDKSKEPPRELPEIAPTDDWSKWNNLSTVDKSNTEEPSKYNWKLMMANDWCGTYYLQNEHTEIDENGNEVKKKVSAEIGDGTFENPAGLNTDVITYVIDKNANKYPISIRMIEYGVSEDAIRWFESQDVRNRGIDVTSEVQYVYYVFEVTNKSDVEITIEDNSSLSDKSANIASRTGRMYGIQESVTLKPDETGIIESWSRSTELNKRYVIWGKDFARKEDPVWFRVLAGNIDDDSENKGVSLNTSRADNEEEREERNK